MESMIHEVTGEFQNILDYLKSSAQNEQLHEVEKQIFRKLLDLGKGLLKVFLEAKGDGNVGNSHSDKLGIRRELQSSKKNRIYYSVFGKVTIKRAYYLADEVHGFCPLDAMLNLPEKSYSYLLAQWSNLLGSREAYKKSAEVLQEILGLQIYNEPIKMMIQETSTDVEKFYQQQPAPEKNSEGEILVATADCKGITIKKDKPAPKKQRLKKGEKPGKKKMATATALYTIDRHHRDINDIVKEVSETHKAFKGQQDHPKQNNVKRPKPKNKIVRATMAGKETAFDKLFDEVEKRTHDGIKDKVFLLDGETKLRKLATSFTGFCIIMDLYHVLEYLWEAAYVFHKEGSEEAQAWVTSRLRLLLLGKVACIITSLKYEVQHRQLTSSKMATLKKVITYLHNGQPYMKYHLYIAKGYPIGSGVIEGTCRNLVNDRFGLTGMRWSVDGAESLLKIRSLDLNQKFDSFWHFRIKREFCRLYEEYDINLISNKISA